MISIKYKSKSGRSLVSACIILVSIPFARGAVVESFESGTLNGWVSGTLNGASTTVDMVRATDGTFSAANSFTVPASFSGWTVNTIMLILNNSNGWQAVAPTSGALANGAFSTLTWDMTPYAAAITDPGLGYSSLGIAWHVGTWAGGGDGLDNGTQTFAIDNITVTTVPEPSSALALLSTGLMTFRRRRRR